MLFLIGKIDLNESTFPRLAGLFKKLYMAYALFHICVLIKLIEKSKTLR